MNVIFICVIVFDKMCFHMLNLCWFKHKKIFECFRCFWKVFCFYKNWKISKTVLPYFGDLVTGHLSRMPQSQAGGSVLVTCSRVEGPVAKGTQIFSRLSLRLPCEWDFQSRKILSKFFQNFWLEVFWRVKLVTFWRLTSVAKNAWLAKVGLFLKGVQFSLEPFMTIHFLSQLKLTQTLRVTLYKLHFCIISTQNP